MNISPFYCNFSSPKRQPNLPKKTAFYRESDLAFERTSIPTNIKGVVHTIKRENSVAIRNIEITNEAAEKAIGKPRGQYTTIEFPALWQLTPKLRSTICKSLCQALDTMAQPYFHKMKKSECVVLIVGLGNRHLIADAIGPMASDLIHATYHIKQTDYAMFQKLDSAGICVLSPGVTGDTGLETCDIICNAAKVIIPNLIVCIDALVAKSPERLATTIQLTDAGITPGSGISAHKKALTKETTGVPTIAIGVPTVASAYTLLHDTLFSLGMEEKAKHLYNKKGQTEFFVCPKDIDFSMQATAFIIADAINKLWGIPNE